MSKPASEIATYCASLVSEVALDAGQTTKRIMLFPMGDHRPKNGNPKRLRLRDRAHAERVVAATLASLGNADFAVDYDHQMPRAPSVAGKAIAAGWIKPATITAEDDGIWGEAEFTPAAASHLAAREYRYSSPYMYHTAEGDLTRLINIALTNTPNLDIPAVASSITEKSTEEDGTEMLKTIATALGLAATADEAAVLAAITANKAKTDAFEATASALGVELKDGEYAAVASAATALKDAKPGAPDPAKFVPVEKLNEVLSEMSALKTSVAEIQTDKRTGLINAALNDGRLPPALKSHAESITDETALCSFLDGLPNGFGKVEAPKKGGGGGKVEHLDAEQKALCSSMGWDEAAYLKTLNSEVE